MACFAGAADLLHEQFGQGVEGESGWPGALALRIYVLNSGRGPAAGNQQPATSNQLSLLGYFTIPDAPTFRDNGRLCNGLGLGTMSPDGKTLFYLGDA